MTDSRIEKLTAHYVKETPHPEVVGVEELRKEAIWHIADIEAAGLVVIDPDTVDSDYALSIYESALSREIDEATADIARLAFGDGAR